MMCNTTFLNHKDYRFRVKNFVWNIKIEGLPGDIYVEEPNLIFGMNCFSKFMVISPESGAILDTLNPYTIDQEREDGLSNYNISVDKQKYSEVTLKVIPRQYRGDTETFYLIIKNLSNKEYTILFNRRQFPGIRRITYYKDGKFVMTYNAEAGSEDDKIPYKVYIGLFDLKKIIKN